MPMRRSADDDFVRVSLKAEEAHHADTGDPEGAFGLQQCHGGR